MRRIIKGSLLLVIIILAGCGSGSSANTIAVSELTEREQVMLSATADQALAFDFEMDDPYKELTLWIEKYEKGVKTEEKLTKLTTQASKNGLIIFTSKKVENDDNLLSLHLAIHDEKGTAVGGSLDTLEKADYSISYGSIQDESLELSENFGLATIIYTKGNQVLNVSNDFYQNADEHLDEIKDYDIVYLLRGTFHKSDNRD